MNNDTNKMLNDLFNKAKNEPSKVSFEETKERFITSVSKKNNATKGNNFARFFNLKLIIMIASIITTIALVLVLKPISTTKTAEKENTTNTSTIVTTVENEKQVLQEQQQVITKYLQKVDRLTPKNITLNQEKVLLIPTDSLKNTKKH